MQLMSWMMARLGSRFSLLFEPHRNHVKHAALGRFMDQPLDLMVGLVEPDGSARVLPFTRQGSPLLCCEQTDRMNSITFRGYSEHYQLQFEFNVHSVFYPQNEALCTMPAFYLEMRICPCKPIRGVTPKAATPKTIELFIKLDRPDTSITTSLDGPTSSIHLAYQNALTPQFAYGDPLPDHAQLPDTVAVHERITSLNPGCQPSDNGQGLSLTLPVTQTGSGIKWRLVWAAHCGQPVLHFHARDTLDKSIAPQASSLPTDQTPRPPATGDRVAYFRYAKRLKNIDDVMADAIEHRDQRLVLSRQFEKIFDQAPLRMAQRHIVHLGFQSFLSNTFWCDVHDASQENENQHTEPWFSVWDGRGTCHASIDVEYHHSLWYLSLWPSLLEQQFKQWATRYSEHVDSQGAILWPSAGLGSVISAPPASLPPPSPLAMPVEVNSSFLILLQTYVHWTGKTHLLDDMRPLIEKLARYLLWCDDEACGYPTVGQTSTHDDALPALHLARRQTYLGVKRLAGLGGAADLLSKIGSPQLAKTCATRVEHDAGEIEIQSWLGDHYAVCADPTTTGLVDPLTNTPLAYDDFAGWDDYCIHSANGLLLPALIGQPWLLSQLRLRQDLTNAQRETLSPYGCGHSSSEPSNIRISQNMWRDHLACYLGLPRPHLTQRYWDLQVASNIGNQSNGFVDGGVTNNLCFASRGATALGFLLSEVRLIIDRLAPGGQRISIDPISPVAQRWPLLPLADWKAGKIPVCVISGQGKVSIESETDPVIIHSPNPSQGAASNLIG